jgi:hypothetical protein
MIRSSTVLLAVLLEVLGGVHVLAQRPTGGLSVEESNQLLEEAIALAVDRLGRMGLPAAELPVSPSPALVDSIHRSLIAIYELTSPARDSVFDVYDIHGWTEGMYESVVDIDAGAPWLDAWRQGSVATGDLAVDSILEPLDVWSVEPRERAFYGDRAFLLQFRVPVNWWILDERLTRSPYVDRVSPRLLQLGGGHYVALERGDGQWLFRFSIGWTDCPSGCADRYEWRFEVNDDGSARFVGGSGDPIPADLSVIP